MKFNYKFKWKTYSPARPIKGDDMKFKIQWKLMAITYLFGAAVATYLGMHFLGSSFTESLLNSLISAVVGTVPLFAIITGYRFIKYQSLINEFLLKRADKNNQIIWN